ncbi:hypothetical protein J2797_005556 [Paraburkholderia terricola]|uniref:hypothetical protein n=1 Tax=Paraburkholderia terricola TaxID=169427 RepID=UPI00286478A3|nr:hypothetical protein [Paraburkholderia terricola]MDR6495632.1 hypothetical protein [Paraburkholderia terricola]
MLIDYSDMYVRVKLHAQDGCVGLKPTSVCKQAAGEAVDQNAPRTDNTDASMGYPSNGIFSRYFIQPQRSVTVTAKLSAGAFVVTAPLLSLSQSGGRTGDAWSRTVYSRSEDFQWFLVKRDGSNSVLSAQFTLNAAKSIQFQGAVTGLNVAVSLARELAPQGTLLTELTANYAKTRADALDKTISSLFAMTIAETHAVDLDLRHWRKNQSLKLDVSVPAGSAINGQVSPVGSWALTLAAPRPSIFADIRICSKTEDSSCVDDPTKAKAKVIEDVRAADVLSFSVIPLTPPNTALGSIATYISQHDGFSTGVASIAAEKEAKPGGPVTASFASAQLCKNILQWTSSLGFSSLDQDIILWSVATGMSSIPQKTGEKLLMACDNDEIKALSKRSISPAVKGAMNK